MAEVRFLGARKHENRPCPERENIPLDRLRMAGTDPLNGRF